MAINIFIYHFNGSIVFNIMLTINILSVFTLLNNVVLYILAYIYNFFLRINS